MARPREFDAETVIDAAVDDFWSSTFSATSTDELCRSTGLSRSSLYNAFGNKRDLYLSAIHRYAEMNEAERAVILESGATGRAVLEQIVAASLDRQWADADRRACFGINACLDEGASDAEIARALERNARLFDDALTEVVRRGQRDGSIRDALPAADLAHVIHAFLDGLQVRTRVRPSRDEQRRDVDAVLALL